MKKGLLYVLGGALMWGTLPVFSRIAYANGSDPLTAGAWRAYIAAAVFLVWFLIDGTFKKLRRKDIPFYIVYGLLGVGGTFVFYMLAVNMLSTAMAAMLLYTAPAFVILFNRIIYKDRITKLKVAALCCTFFGCFLVVRGYDFQSLRADMPGILVGLLSGLSYSMVTVMGRAAGKKNDARTNAGLMILFGSSIFLFLRPPFRLSLPTPVLLGCYLGLAALGSVFAYLFYLRGMAEGLDGAIASIAATVEPVIATILGIVIFKDPFELWQALGMAIVVFGAALPFLLRKKTGSGISKDDTV